MRQVITNRKIEPLEFKGGRYCSAPDCFRDAAFMVTFEIIHSFWSKREVRRLACGACCHVIHTMPLHVAVAL